MEEEFVGIGEHRALREQVQSMEEKLQQLMTSTAMLMLQRRAEEVEGRPQQGIDEFVRKEHFEEFSRRMDERFQSVEKRMEQGFSHAAKEREQNFNHLNQTIEQGFRNLEKRFGDQRRVVLIMLGAMVTATLTAIVGAAIKYIFFPG